MSITISVAAKPCFPIMQNPPFVIQMVALDGNNVNAWIINTGIFDQDLRSQNTPGFEWPKNSGSFAIYTTGLSIAAIVNGVLKEAMASYKGEYGPGYIYDSAGNPKANTDNRFHIYKVKKGDNANTNLDWYYWGYMVFYGAPFIDVNHNGFYEPFIDTPGVKDASQTIFVCLTDGFPERHQIGEGFGGGTAPLFAEVHMTAWTYDNPPVQDVQFIRWNIINKSHANWDSTYTAILCDADLGCANDDYTGCDTTRQLGYCYNGEAVDCNGTFRYPGVPPAVGFQWLNCSGVNNLELKSFFNFKGTSVPGPNCESDPNGEQVPAYYLLRGIKKDRTPWVVPPGGQQNVTKYCYSGDPETGTGWTEGLPGNPTGSIWNCGGPGVYTGTYHNINLMGDRRFCMSSGSDNNIIHPNDTIKIMIAQFIAQGTSYLNSVTRLKILADTVKAFCSRGFVIGTDKISSSVPERFMLFQNYPNPFNPTTNIKYQIAKNSNVSLKVYDILGKEVITLVNEKLQPGTYSTDWDATNYPSGVYFYQLIADGNVIDTKKMILLK